MCVCVCVCPISWKVQKDRIPVIDDMRERERERERERTPPSTLTLLPPHLLPTPGSGNFNRPRTTSSRPVAMSVLSPHKSWDEATSSGRSQGEGLMDMSPSRGSNMEFDLPTPTRRKRKPSSFDAMAAARQQRQSVLILDEVSV